jgi:hypothetical protein
MVSVFHRPRSRISSESTRALRRAVAPPARKARAHKIRWKEAQRLAHDGDRETEGCSYVGGPEAFWGRCFGEPVGGKQCVFGRGVEPKVEDAARGGANWAAESVQAEAMGDYFATDAIFLCGEYQLNRSCGKYICRRGRACIEDLLAQK